jgi:hypothetical protein
VLVADTDDAVSLRLPPLEVRHPQHLVPAAPLVYGLDGDASATQTQPQTRGRLLGSSADRHTNVLSYGSQIRFINGMS